MRPIPARHILAVAQAGLFVLLILVGHAQRQEELAEQRISKVVRWEFRTSPAEQLPIKVAFFLNAPAVLAGGLLALVAGYESDVYVFVLSIPFVLFLWYLIGRELDKRRDLIPTRAPPVTWLRRVLIPAGLILSILLSFLFLAAYMTYQTSHGESGDSALPLDLWFGLATYVLWRKLRRRRSPGNTPSELRITS